MDSPAMRAHKKQLRARLRARRRRLYDGPEGARRREKEAAGLLEHADELVSDIARRAEGGVPPLVAAFHPTPLEADVMPLARELAHRGARLIFPAAAERDLDWVAWDGDSDFTTSPGRGFGREPLGPRLGTDALARAELVLAPAVAVDRSGTRIGHGAGYYDRALTHVPSGTTVVAVIHPEELLEAGTLPRGEFDVPIRQVLTADGLITLEVS